MLFLKYIVLLGKYARKINRDAKRNNMDFSRGKRFEGMVDIKVKEMNYTTHADI